MYNSSSQEWTNWTVGPLVNTFTIDRKGVAEECAELLLEVSAANVVGESQSYSVNGGFPTGKVIHVSYVLLTLIH